MGHVLVVDGVAARCAAAKRARGGVLGDVRRDRCRIRRQRCIGRGGAERRSPSATILAGAGLTLLLTAASASGELGPQRRKRAPLDGSPLRHRPGLRPTLSTTRHPIQRAANPVTDSGHGVRPLRCRSHSTADSHQRAD